MHMINFVGNSTILIPCRSNPLSSQTSSGDKIQTAEPMRDYVAELQLHMTLQARKLVPSLTNISGSRQQLLQETQAEIEKAVSRQV